MTIRTYTNNEASPISPDSGVFYERIRDVAHDLFPEAILTPYLVTGGTDSRKYAPVCDHIYRFTPCHVTNDEQQTMHNANESLSVENVAQMITFFDKFLRSW